MLKLRSYYFLWLTIIVLFLTSCNKEPEIKSVQSEQFIKVFGGRGMDCATDMIEYESGFAFTGTMLTSDSAMQAFLIVTDSLGNELPWSPVLFGGILNDIGNKIFRLQSGDFIIVGTKVLPGNAADSCDILVAKIGTDGVIKWLKSYGGSLSDEGLFGLETTSNEIVFGGYTKSFGKGAKDICLYKINTDGELIWSPAPTFGASFDDIGEDIVQMNNSLYILGTTQSYNISNKKEIFVIEADINNGKPLNMNYFGDADGSLEGRSFIVLPNGNLLILAQLIQDNTGSAHLYIIQLNKDLYQTIWSKLIPADENEYVADILYKQNEISVYCTNVKAENSRLKVHTLNGNGDLIGSAFLTNKGQQNFKTVVFTTNFQTGIAGSSVFGNNSKVLLMKGIYR